MPMQLAVGSARLGAVDHDAASPLDQTVSVNGRRLALVINQLRLGGAETQVSLLAREFAARGWTVAVFSVRPPLALATELQASGIPVHTMQLPFPRRAWLGTRWMVRELRRFRPDVVHSHMYRPNIWMRLLRPALRPTVLVSTAHNSAEGDEYSEERGRPELLYRLTDRLCDLTTNVSRAAVERYVRLRAAPEKRIRYMPNGVDTRTFAPSPTTRALTRAALGLGERPVLLAVGRLTRQKNYPLLLAAFARVHARHPEALLLVVGSGPDGFDDLGLSGLAAQLGLQDSVRFLGLRDDIPALMNAADLYVMSSDWEGLPIVLLEASAMGLPMVVTNVGGNTEIVEDGVSGFVVPPGEPAALAEAIGRFLDLPQEARARMGTAARSRAVSEYSIEQVVSRWEALYNELLTAKARRVRRSAARQEILSDSDMWQSPTWVRHVASVYRVGSRPRFLNHPVALALQLFLRRRGYGTVMTTGTKCSLLYGLLCLVTLQPQRQVVCQLYLDPPRGFLAPIQDALARLVLRGTRGVIVSTRGEVPVLQERFGVPRSRIRHVAFHTNVVEPRDLGCATGPVFAGGRNYRDYETLVEAVRDSGIELVIVCGKNQLLDTPLPPNVRVFRELAYKDYLKLMRDASAVVIPLASTTVPSGHSSILEAMAYGKPVITVASFGTADYVRDGIDGLTYREGDVADLRAQLEQLTSDPEQRARLGRAAYEQVMARFTFEVHADTKLRAIRELTKE